MPHENNRSLHCELWGRKKLFRKIMEKFLISEGKICGKFLLETKFKRKNSGKDFKRKNSDMHLSIFLIELLSKNAIVILFLRKTIFGSKKKQFGKAIFGWIFGLNFDDMETGEYS